MARTARLQWTHNGVTQSISVWAATRGTSYHTLYRRHYRDGLSIADALTRPKRHGGPRSFVAAVARYLAQQEGA